MRKIIQFFKGIVLLVRYVHWKYLINKAKEIKETSTIRRQSNLKEKSRLIEDIVEHDQHIIDLEQRFISEKNHNELSG